MLQRLKVILIGVVVVVVYFWTGAVAKLWLLSRATAQAPQMAPAAGSRPYRGHPRVGINLGYVQMLNVYGPVPLHHFLVPGAASFLRGLGVGLDPAEERYDAARREALERAARTSFLNPWRNHARLELAALDALPAGISPMS